jgi:hypothetical protein
VTVLQKNKELKRSESVTFRFPKDLLSGLQEEAERKEISLNTLMTQVARRHVNWYSNAASAGFISITKSFLMLLMQKISEEDMKSMAEDLSKRETKDFVLLLRNRYDIISALDVIETWIRISGYPYRHNIKNNIHSVVIQHDMGKKWSIRLAETYRYILKEFKVNSGQIFDLGENVLSFIIDVPDTTF